MNYEDNVTVCPRCGTTYSGEGMCPNCPFDVDLTATYKLKGEDELTLQKYIDAAMKELDELDYILSLDLQWICAVRPISGGQLNDLYEKILERANIWPAGAPVRLAWCRVLDGLKLIVKQSRKEGI